MLTVFISPVPKLISSTSTVTVFVYLAVSYNESTLQDYGVDSAASDNRITNADNPVLPMDNVTVINIASEENASVIDVFAAGNNTLKTLAYLRPILWSPSKIAVLIVTLSIMFETVIGNCLVVLSVLMEKKLQTPFNYYILNLALTNLNVGLSAMPLFTIMNLYGYFPFDSYACSYWMWNDYAMTFESVIALAAISIDRLWSVTWSLHYRKNNSKWKSLLIIAFTWFYVNLIWIPAFVYDRLYHPGGPGKCVFELKRNLKTVVYLGVLGFYIPLIIMLFAYARLIYVMRKRLVQIAQQESTLWRAAIITGHTRAQNNSTSTTKPSKSVTTSKNNTELPRARRERKAFYTLGHVVIVFLICWIPFYLFFLISPFLPDFFPTWFGEFSYWMAYLNSAINPLVCGIGNEDFKRIIKKIIISCGYCRGRKHRENFNAR